jgi:hypothetical protein
VGRRDQSNGWEIFCSDILGHVYGNQQEPYRADTLPCALTVKYVQATPVNYVLKTGGK